MIIAGFGFRASASMDSLLNALEKACLDFAISPVDIHTIAAPDDKIESAALRDLCVNQSLTVVPVSASDLTSAETLTNAPRVRELRGTGSVAEACARVAIGPAGELLGPRIISDDRMATCALAKGEPQ